NYGFCIFLIVHIRHMQKCKNAWSIGLVIKKIFIGYIWNYRIHFWQNQFLYLFFKILAYCYQRFCLLNNFLRKILEKQIFILKFFNALWLINGPVFTNKKWNLVLSLYP